jgi:hypothetical protein
VTVNTQAAAFVNVPQYFVTVELKVKDTEASALPQPPLIVEATNTYFKVLLPDWPPQPGGTGVTPGPGVTASAGSTLGRLFGRRATPPSSGSGGGEASPGAGTSTEPPEITIAWVGIEV